MSVQVLRSAVEAIGNTPLVRLDRLTARAEYQGGTVLAKLEYLNPGHSKKDRIARQIIEGTGLAIVCGVKGYQFVAVMSRGNSSERARMMRALGAEVVLVDQAPGGIPGQVSGEDIKLLEDETDRLVVERGAFRADQFQNRGNFRAHYLHTAAEILEATDGRIDAFCDFLGSGGTFGGCATRFKEHGSGIKCYVVEPQSAALLSGSDITNPSHKIQGGGYMRSLDVLPLVGDKSLIDGYIQVSDDEAVAIARRLATEEGVFGGFSSGANVCAALKLLQRPEFAGATIVTLICDSGLKYLSTDLWD